jgi:tight adherence protein B
MELALALLVFVMVLGVGVYAIGAHADAGGQNPGLMRRIARPSADSQEIMRAMPRLRAGQSRFGWFYRFDLMQKLEESLWQAGIYMRVSDVLLIMLVMFGAGAAIGVAIWQDPTISIAVATGFTALPVVYVRLRRRWRLKAFVHQLPFALDLIKSSLEAGHSLMRGLQVVVAEFQEPIATEFRSVIEQSRLGLPMPRAMEEMLKRVPEEDLRLLVVAIRVQSEVGSSLAHIIGRLSDIVRTRQRIQSQIHSLTAQSRLSGWIMGALPIVVLAAFSVIQPSYSHTLFHDPSGIKILKIAGFLDLLAFVSIKKLLDVKF